MKCEWSGIPPCSPVQGQSKGSWQYSAITICSGQRRSCWQGIIINENDLKYLVTGKIYIVYLTFKKSLDWNFNIISKRWWVTSIPSPLNNMSVANLQPFRSHGISWNEKRTSLSSFSSLHRCLFTCPNPVPVSLNRMILERQSRACAG